MKTVKFYAQLRKQIEKRNDLKIQTDFLKYKNGGFPFWRISSAKISRKDKIIMLCAGVHGDEIAGPLTFYHHLDKIVDLIHGNGFKVIIYPLRNPSGFEKGLRYNIDNDKGDAGNNDFIRYELANGAIVDDLKDKNVFKKWYWASDKRLKTKLPLETRLFHRLLKKDLKYDIVACLDLHQDVITPNAKPAAYNYAFGNTAIYKPIAKEIGKIVPIWKNKLIGAGFNTVITEKGAVQQKVPRSELMKSDKLGFVERFDGTLGDLMQRMGVPHSITVETTGATPLQDAMDVNLIWISGIVDILG